MFAQKKQLIITNHTILSNISFNTQSKQ